MIDQRILDLIERLAEKAEGLAWEQDTGTGGYFIKLGDNFAEIRSDDRDDSHPYTFLILDSDEKTMESLNTLGSDVSAKYRNLVEQTYHVARRKAQGLDDVLDEMLKKLD